MAFLRSPSSKFSYVKNRGTITVGIKRLIMGIKAIEVTAKVNTSAGPDFAIIHNISGITTAIKTITIANFFSSSTAKVPGVILLKPYFSSITK